VATVWDLAIFREIKGIFGKVAIVEEA